MNLSTRRWRYKLLSLLFSIITIFYEKALFATSMPLDLDKGVKYLETKEQRFFFADEKMIKRIITINQIPPSEDWEESADKVIRWNRYYLQLLERK